MATQLPVGGQGIATDASGDIVADVLAQAFADNSTSLTMVAANAIQITGWRHKSVLMSELSRPENSTLKRQLNSIVGLMRKYEDAWVSAAADEAQAASDEEQGSATAATAAAAAAGTGTAPQSAAADHLKSASFDGIVAAVCSFMEKHALLAVQGTDPEVVIQDIRALLAAVMAVELQKAVQQEHWQSAPEAPGTPGAAHSQHQVVAAAPDTPDSSTLIAEWSAAHSMRTMEGHPLDNAVLGEKVLALFCQAVRAHHPALQRIPHVACCAARAAAEHVGRVKAKAEERLGQSCVFVL